MYLTNALTGWDTDSAPNGETLFPELVEELRSAATVKRTEPILVVIGNPPYEGYSTAETAEERRMLTPWTGPLWSEWGVRKHRLNDLYVRFWRVALERIVQLTGRGVISFITNRKWLAGRSYPAMRENVVTSFQVVRVDDLHGAADDVTHPGDQSIFSTTVATGIKRGTAIVTAVRTGTLENNEVAVSSGGRDTRLDLGPSRGPTSS
jgi:predicted helicase